jgi:hypothetical protein
MKISKWHKIQGGQGYNDQGVYSKISNSLYIYNNPLSFKAVLSKPKRLLSSSATLRFLATALERR